MAPPAGTMDEADGSSGSIVVNSPFALESSSSSESSYTGEPTRNNPSLEPLKDEALGDTCRICRSEGTLEEPLFYPCKCSGSIRYVHQECLMEWLSHSHKKHCELCKTPFRFTKLYDAEMPTSLPVLVFIERACLHVVEMVKRCGRGVLVSIVWLAILPWLVRWMWRWMFWFTDAGWARDAFATTMQVEKVISQTHWHAGNDGRANLSSLLATSVYPTLSAIWEQQNIQTAMPAPDLAMKTLSAILGSLGLELGTGNITDVLERTNASASSKLPSAWPRADGSILSSWKYIAEMTPYPTINRIVLDVFEGQLITCVVIAGFILVFLIREWVVQQQPLVNIDNLANELRERNAQDERDLDRVRRQAELLEQARVRLESLQHDVHLQARAFASENGLNETLSWDALNDLIDATNDHFRRHGYDVNDLFTAGATAILAQIRVAERNGVNVSELRRRISLKISALPDHERQIWENVLVAKGNREGTDPSEPPSPTSAEATNGVMIDPLRSIESDDPYHRPSMPDRGISFRATQIQRALEESEIRNNVGSSSSQHLPHSSRFESQVENATEHLQRRPSSNGPLGDGQRNNASETNPAADDSMPIINGGPEAKLNIRYSGTRRAISIPEPNSDPDDSTLVAQAETQNRGDYGRRSRGSTQEQPDNPLLEEDVRESEDVNVNAYESDTLSDRLANVFREEIGLDPIEDAQDYRDTMMDASADQIARPAPANGADLDAVQARVEPDTALGRAVDWFWGDLNVLRRPEEDPADVHEGRANVDVQDREAPFAPEPNALADADGAIDRDLEPDPEVLAAAQQAGLDAEALEDAEDLEGMLELIGLQGPLLGLFQTSSFCSILVTGTVFGAVGLPYMWGKLVLSFIGSPASFLIKAPLQLASSLADIIVDITLVTGGWLITTLGLGLDLPLSAIKIWVPSLAEYDMTGWLTNVALSTATTAGSRLQKIFTAAEPPEPLVWRWAFLHASVHAHASLKDLKDDVNRIMYHFGNTITILVDVISAGSTTLAWERALQTLVAVSDIPGKVLHHFNIVEKVCQSLANLLQGLKTGALTFQTTEMSLDPSLVYWTSMDRALAVLAGYTALAALAAVYVALDTPITRSQAGQRTEKIIRDTLRQAGGVLKVILIISIEMLVFPLYCGLLLDLAFLPLFRHASVATRWVFAMHSPYTFCFVHWFVGTCYMFHFALFVGMCRKILRKGVLWFIRDPDDPTFHPVRDVLERSVTTQLRKIAFSALVYGALVILCLGGVIWSIGRLFEGIFPINWVSTEPVLEFPLDLLLYNFFTPLVIRLFKPSDVVHALYAWWLRRCARALRLSHFLFGDRRKDEEGTKQNSRLLGFLPSFGIHASHDVLEASHNEQGHDPVFVRDGRFVLTPCSDQYRPPKPNEAFIHAGDDDVYIANKDGKKNDHFAKVYVPPHFQLRVTFFMMCLWMFSAFAGLCVTLVPLILGRQLLQRAVISGIQVNDIYAYSAGAYILAGIVYTCRQVDTLLALVARSFTETNIHDWIRSRLNNLIQTLRCIYVYGFLGVVLPLLFALLFEFYLIVPLHTYLDSVQSRPPLGTEVNDISNRTLSSSTNGATNPIAGFSQADVAQNNTSYSIYVNHNMHILGDYALGLLYARIAVRFVMAAPASRATEAFRLITAKGYLNPDAALATRYLILPTTLLAALILCGPLWLSMLGVTLVETVGSQIFSIPMVLEPSKRTLLYRYSYPLSATWLLALLGALEITKATTKWGARIRDEVYLVGERLHNFGEKKPPVGSKTVIRRVRRD